MTTAGTHDSTTERTVDSELGLLEFAAHFRVSIARLARILRQLDSEGLSPTQGAALATIDAQGPITLGALASFERVAKPTISAVVGKLEERNFVRRLTDPVDGRICRVEATDAGRDYLVASRSRRTAWLVDRFDDCTPEEIADLRRAATVLDRMTERTTERTTEQRGSKS